MSRIDSAFFWSRHVGSNEEVSKAEFQDIVDSHLSTFAPHLVGKNREKVLNGILTTWNTINYPEKFDWGGPRKMGLLAESYLKGKRNVVNPYNVHSSSSDQHVNNIAHAVGVELRKVLRWFLDQKEIKSLIVDVHLLLRKYVKPGFALTTVVFLITLTIPFVMTSKYVFSKQEDTSGSTPETVEKATVKEEVELLKQRIKRETSVNPLVVERLSEIVNESKNDPYGSGFAKHVLGLAFEKKGEYSKATAYLLDSIEDFQNADSTTGMFDCHVLLLKIADAKNELELARKRMDNAFQLLSHVPDDRKAYFYTVSARYFQQTGNLNEALFRAKKACELYGEVDRPASLFDAKTKVAFLYINLYYCTRDEKWIKLADRTLDEQELYASLYVFDYPAAYYSYRVAKVAYWKVQEESIPQHDIEGYLTRSGNKSLEKTLEVSTSWPDCQN